MATVEEHYNNVLSRVYSWMLGGFDLQLEKNKEFFAKWGILPNNSRVALDLGAGCGFQSIPLTELGYSVIAIDSNKDLLTELKKHDLGKTVKVFNDDLLNFDKYLTSQAELIVCMTDTILHLESKEKVQYLFNKVIDSLERNGKFIITFRDLSNNLEELDRFIPVKHDKKNIFTCFLEYMSDRVKVHDLLYRYEDKHWLLYKSFYHKLRLSPSWVEQQLNVAKYMQVIKEVDNGFVTFIATKSA